MANEQMPTGAEVIKNAEQMLEYLWLGYDAAVETNRVITQRTMYVISGSTAAFGFLGSSILKSGIRFDTVLLLSIALFCFVAQYILAALIWFPYETGFPVGPDKHEPGIPGVSVKYFQVSRGTVLANHMRNVCRCTELELTATNRWRQPLFVGFLIVSLLPNSFICLAFLLRQFNAG